MKKTLFLIILYSNALICQISKGKVVDIETNIPLDSVSIIDTENKVITVTNKNGGFEISSLGNYTFKKIGYKTKAFNIDSNYTVIQLSYNPNELNEVIISTAHLPGKLKKSIYGTSFITTKDLNSSINTNIQHSLNKIPGVFMQSGALNTNRITIRGVGSRNLFGTAKIRAYFKDIPLTNGSGESNIEDFELASLSRIEITKGATSLYGAGLGGTIRLVPKNTALNQKSFEAEFSTGSFGLTKETLSLGYGSFKNSLTTIFSNTILKGFRDNSNYKRQTFTINDNLFVGQKDELSFLANHINLKAFIPSSLDMETYTNNPSSAAYTWKQAKGFEDYSRGLLGISWNHQFQKNLKLTTSIFSSFKTNYEPRPFDILDEQILATGLRSRLNDSIKLLKKQFNWSIGGELFYDTSKYSTSENLYQEYPEGTGSVKGSLLSNYQEKRGYTNIFSEVNYSSESLMILLGFNYNQTWYRLKDRFPIDSENLDQSGYYKFSGILSPTVGISYQIAKPLSIYTNITHGFSPISLSETLLPNGMINYNLKPETGWNYEIGSNGSLLKNKLSYNISLYRLDIRNLLVSRRTLDNQYIGINAGETQHDGLELSLRYTWFINNDLYLRPFLTYSLNDYHFKNFIDNESNYSGNKLTGIPQQVFNAGIDFDTKKGFYGNLYFQSVDSMPITDDNSLFSDCYKLINLKLGYKNNINNNLKANLFYGINNLFNEKYASQILINASGFNGNSPRYFYPGEPTNYYTGININYHF
ncbi:TonB-dependent receptor domain-containing protein [Aestuariibaculum suncheonense]|uniref:TonB-dependent receptor n=1 Tax=Aestuariibaculum suncheonense TaxID=1028745 RepID=A0A8J6Q7M6_9FLAO|nr:TonB-dependent receptor [Aestuariibaculum suncheonense]MBD0835391.1 TonB-dependent receptor [Aestuariibaculum suncheonense]